MNISRQARDLSRIILTSVGVVLQTQALKIYTLTLAVIMAEETDAVLLKAVVWLQKRQERLRDGFSVEFKGEEYIFIPKYIDRSA